jgi:transposase
LRGGERQRAIARVTGHSRSSIRRWLCAGRRLGWEPGQGEPDEPLAAAVAKRVLPVWDEAAPGQSQTRPLTHREQIRAWFEPEDERRGLRLTKVQQLIARQGVEVPYSSLHRFTVRHLASRPGGD